LNLAYRAFNSIVIPAAVLAVAYLLIGSGEAVPPTLSGLKIYGPYASLALGGAMSLWFNRSRAFLAVLTLTVAYIAYRMLLINTPLAQNEVRTAFAGLCVFVPANLALFSVLSERGLFNAYGLRRLLVIAVEVAFVFWLINTGLSGFAEWVSQPLFEWAWLKQSVVPQGAMLVMLLSFSMAAVRPFLEDAPVDASLAWSIVAFALAAHHADRPSAFGLFIASGALLLLIGVLQDSRRMAFRDDLTGLPSRRALNERLMGLGRTFSIAMLDIDHFKKLNDTYGHDVGDQVLKMVAARLAQVRRGGRAFRYGGEEFALVFAGRSVRDVLPELEALRDGIEQHRMALRGPDRPAESKAGRSRRAGGSGESSVSVTISIGVAERSESLRAPEEVLKAADQALYRAKDRGRNRVSR
jgi:diguanylate cyclase (GGDEF)-like protein